MKQRLKRAVVLTLVFALVLTMIPVASVWAHDGEDDTSNREVKQRTSEELKTHLEEQKQRRQQLAEKRLDDAKKRVCEKRKKNITSIMERSTKRAEEHAVVFESIANRTKAFYEKKGNTIGNYSELVAAVNAAKSKVDADVAALKNIEPFDCSSNDPKGVADDFKAVLKTLTTDLKEYRTAVKNLIVGVKSAQAQDRRNQ